MSTNPRFREPRSDDVESDNVIPLIRVNNDSPLVRFGQGGFMVHIDNANGKININLADRKTLSLLVNNTDLDDEQKEIVVDSIMDWRDADHMHRINGAEDKYYQDLGRGYECKDGPFDTVEELLYVRGITDDLYHHRLKDIVTVYPKYDDTEYETKPQSLREKHHRLSQKYSKINVNSRIPGNVALPARHDRGARQCHFTAPPAGRYHQFQHAGRDRGNGDLSENPVLPQF